MANANLATLVAVNIDDLLRQVEQARACRVHALETLIGNLTAASSSEEECSEFDSLIAASQGLLDLDDANMATLLKVSRPTISRWTRGKTSPHPVVRNAMFSVLIKSAQSKVRSLQH